MSTQRILALVLLLASVASAEEAATEAWLLRYRFTAGEQVRWKVVHLATTETSIQGNTQSAKSRSASNKVWKVSKVDAGGDTTFVYSVESVDMWQQLPDRPEVRYNSDSDQEVPDKYAHVPPTVGVPLATVTISPKGDVIERDTPTPNESFGVGGMVMLLP
jgi:hypothetical protein